nr:hypothetical protein [uncultured Leptotrichia sp.]
MNNKKKIILFLGAISLIAFGNYRQFMKNNKQKTVVEGKSSEKASSSSSKEGKSSEKATSSAGNNPTQKAQNTEVMAEIKSVPQPQPAKTAVQNNTDDTKSNKADKNSVPKDREKNISKDKTENSSQDRKVQTSKDTERNDDKSSLKINKNVESQYKLNTKNKEETKTKKESKSSEKATSSGGN